MPPEAMYVMLSKPGVGEGEGGLSLGQLIRRQQSNTQANCFTIAVWADDTAATQHQAKIRRSSTRRHHQAQNSRQIEHSRRCENTGQGQDRQSSPSRLSKYRYMR
jgi:hypothetical protein